MSNPEEPLKSFILSFVLMLAVFVFVKYNQSKSPIDNREYVYLNTFELDINKNIKYLTVNNKKIFLIKDSSYMSNEISNKILRMPLSLDNLYKAKRILLTIKEDKQVIWKEYKYLQRTLERMYNVDYKHYKEDIKKNNIEIANQFLKRN